MNSRKLIRVNQNHSHLRTAGSLCDWIRWLGTLRPLTAFKSALNPDSSSKICPGDCFWGPQPGGLKFVSKVYQNLKNCWIKYVTNFWNFQSPWLEPSKTARTTLGFGRFLGAVRWGVRGFAIWWVSTDRNRLSHGAGHEKERAYPKHHRFRAPLPF